MSVWRNMMNYLGLGPDDAYDDYDVPDGAGTAHRAPDACAFVRR